MRKGYFGKDGAQIHFRLWPAKEDRGKPPVILLPPAPHSGMFFETAAAQMQGKLTVYAVDYPGYGGSDVQDRPPSIESYAATLSPFIRQFDTVVLLGFHTGNLVAIELALRHTGTVNRLILIDVPYFDPERREKYAANLGPDGIPEDIQTSMNTSVKADTDPQAHRRNYALWVESQRAFACRNDAFRAAFAYDAARHAKAVKIPTQICGTESALYGMSENAARDIPNAIFLDWRKYSAPAFERRAGHIGMSIAKLLND